MRKIAGLAASLTLLIAIAGAVPAGAVSKAKLRAKHLSLANFPTGWSVDNSTSRGSGVPRDVSRDSNSPFKY